MDLCWSKLKTIDLFSVLLRADLVLPVGVGSKVEDSTLYLYFWNLDKVLGDGKRPVQDVAHIFDGLEFKHVFELDRSWRLGLEDWSETDHQSRKHC